MTLACKGARQLGRVLGGKLGPCDGMADARVPAMRSVSLAIVAVLVPTVAAAQPSGIQELDQELDALFVPGGLTADAAAVRARQASPAVRKSAASIDVSVANVEAAELVRVPRVGVSATYTRLSPLDPIELGPPGSGVPAFVFLENSYVVQGAVSLALSDYVWRYPKLVAGARLGLQAADAGKRASELDAAQQGRLAYYEWVRARLQVLIARRQLVQVRATLGQVRALASAQRVSRADLMRVESQEAQAEQVHDQLRQLATLREEQLRLLIGAADEPLAVGEDIRRDLEAPGSRPLDELMSTAVRQRLEFRAFDTGIAAKEQQRAAEKASLYPRLSAFGVVDYARPNQRIFPQLDEFRLTWQAGLQLTWTLNDTLITRANIDRLAAETRELRADREQLDWGTRIEVLAAQQAVELAQRALATSSKGLAAAEEGYRVRQALLAADRATAVELVDAETELTRARITALNARIDLRVAISQLRHAIGDDARGSR
jgi:outer membrane protein TolC